MEELLKTLVELEKEKGSTRVAESIHKLIGQDLEPDEIAFEIHHIYGALVDRVSIKL